MKLLILSCLLFATSLAQTDKHFKLWNQQLAKKNLALLTQIEKAVGQKDSVDCNVCAQDFSEAEGCQCLFSMVPDCDPLSYFSDDTCYDCYEETEAVCMEWYEDFAANSGGGDCGTCLEEFASKQGCECMEDDACDVAAAIPDGCHHCGAEAEKFCEDYMKEKEPEKMSCDDCTYKFASAEGCECMMDEQCDPLKLLPEECMHCAEDISGYCQKEMAGKEQIETTEPEMEKANCVGDSSTFDVGFGGCATYAKGNRNYCGSDNDGTHYAYQVCEECLHCQPVEPNTEVEEKPETPEEPEAPEEPEMPEEPETPEEETDACFDNDAAMAAMFQDFMQMETCAGVLNVFECARPFQDYVNMGYGFAFTPGTDVPTTSLRDQGLCSCSCPPAPTPQECCNIDWEGDDEDFCSMEYFIPETVETCGMCLYDRQCAGFQAAYDSRPDPQYATGLVYCCPDAKRCVDQRPEVNHQGCDSSQQEAGCGNYGDARCGAQMQNDEDYPKKCEGLCDNPNFPQDWMASMSCEGQQEESAIGASFFAAATEFDLQEVGLAGFALIGFASSIYLAIVLVQKLTNNKYQTITGNDMPAL